MKGTDFWISGPIVLAACLVMASGVSRAPASLTKPDQRPVLKTTAAVAELKNKLQAVLPKLPAFKEAELVPGESDLELTVLSGSLFQTGTADPLSGVEDQLKTVASVLTLSGKPWRISVEGHTDSSPVVRNRWRYPTNWELSGSRALRIVRVFEESGISGADLEGAGYGSTRPKGKSDEQNRRMVIRIQPSAN